MSYNFALLVQYCATTTLAIAVLLGATSVAQTTARIPLELRGKWVVVKVLNTRTISCWGERDANKLLHSTVEYSSTSITWGKLRINADSVRTKDVSAVQFQEENSSPSVHGSQVGFQQLGIKADAVTEITIEHASAHISKATTEFPGDEVLLKNPNTLIFSVCNIYFEASRTRSK